MCCMKSGRLQLRYPAVIKGMKNVNWGTTKWTQAPINILSEPETCNSEAGIKTVRTVVKVTIKVTGIQVIT